MKAAHTIIVALSLVCIGCTTPPEVKQALIEKDQAYVENERLMQQYRELVGHTPNGINSGIAMSKPGSSSTWRCNGPSRTQN